MGRIAPRRKQRRGGIRGCAGGDRRYPGLSLAARFGRNLTVIGDREMVGFWTWYAIFPCSTAAEPGRHGIVTDCEKRLPHTGSMGFDVVCLPRIHSIGNRFRAGNNHSPAAEPGDAGSCAPVPSRHNYRVGGVPQSGYRREDRNHGGPLDGRSGQGNMRGVDASALPVHGCQWPPRLTAPSLGVLVFKPERV
jgi:hypothetical protein